MKYQYYPGCSLEGTAIEYNIATQAFMEAMGHKILEIEDWTCCGASAAESVSSLLSLALPARVLALAEKQEKIKDILVPCSACYLNLKKVEVKIQSEPGLLETLNSLFEEEEIRLKGSVKVRHLLDVISTDMGPAQIAARVKEKFENLSIAPYYGCQCLRPYAVFDNPEAPISMVPVLKAVGADVHPWEMGGKCCGASHMNTKMDVALELVGGILKGAKGADAIVTVCPMCQMNLEAYQKKISRLQGEDLNISILYLPQLLCLAFGLSEKDVGLDKNLSITAGFRKKAGLM